MYAYRVYLVRRLAWSALMVFAVTAIVFLLMRVAPRSPQATIATYAGVEPQQSQQEIQRRAGLFLQYLQWILDLATGDLGVTLSRRESIAELIQRRGPLTAEIVLFAVTMSWLVGFPLGVISALYPTSAAGIRARALSELFLAIPELWLGMLTVLWLRLWFHQAASPTVVHLWENPWENLQLVMGPGIVLGLGQAAAIVRICRFSWRQIRAGQQEFLATVRPVIRPILLSVLTQSSSLLGALFGGTVLLEVIFGVPGLGRTTVMAIAEGEYFMVLHLLLLYTLGFMLLNLLIDLSSAWFAPHHTVS